MHVNNIQTSVPAFGRHLGNIPKKTVFASSDLKYNYENKRVNPFVNNSCGSDLIWTKQSCLDSGEGIHIL
jgi:hypothetical protein